MGVAYPIDGTACISTSEPRYQYIEWGVSELAVSWQPSGCGNELQGSGGLMTKTDRLSSWRKATGIERAFRALLLPTLLTLFFLVSGVAWAQDDSIGDHMDIGKYALELDQESFVYDGMPKEPKVSLVSSELNRAQLAGLLASVADLEDDGVQNGSIALADDVLLGQLARLTDVSEDTAQYRSIAYLVNASIVTGNINSDGTASYMPLDVPSRDEVAVSLFREADLLDDGEINSSLTNGPAYIEFDDVAIDGSESSRAAIWLASCGIDTGFENNGTREFRGADSADAQTVGAMLPIYCTEILGLDVPVDDDECLAYLGYSATAAPSEDNYLVSYTDNVNAGTAKVVVTGKGLCSGTVEKDFSITRATLTARYAGETIAADGIPELNVAVEGFVNGETPETASGYQAPTVSVPEPLEPAKEYALTPEGGLADNYTFAYIEGNLVVEAPDMFFVDTRYGDEVNHASDVEWMGTTGISTGWVVAGGREYRGNEKVKRCDLAAFLYRLAGCPDFSTTRTFKDVNVSTPHYREIAWMAESGISRGWSDNTFRPMNDVARQDMAAFLYRFADLMDDGILNDSRAMGSEKTTFVDVRHGDDSNHAKEIEWLASHGVTKGWAVNDGAYEFRGLWNAKRQDMAAFLHRLTNNVLSGEGGEYVPATTSSSVLVTFTNGQGGLLKVQTLTPGAAVVPPANPSRTGYTFAGWDQDYENVTVDTIVNARWNINKYTVTFTNGLGKTLKTQTVNYGSSATAPASPTRAGYTFAGWDRGFGKVTANITVNAKWTARQYTVKFTNGLGKTLKTQTVSHGGSATAPAKPSRSGYTFNGWDRSYSNVTSNLTVNATWKRAGGGGGGGSSSGTVYITKTGSKYHRDGCSSLRRSRIAISLNDAVSRGYEPCKNCKPPTL